MEFLYLICYRITCVHSVNYEGITKKLLAEKNLGSWDNPVHGGFREEHSEFQEEGR